MEWTTMLNWRMWCHHIFSSRSQMATANCQSYENVRWKISLMKISITIIAAHIAFVDHFNRGKCSSIPSILHAYSSPPDTMVSMALVYVSFCIVRDTIEGMEQIDVEICCVFEIIEHYKMPLCVSELCYWQHFQRCTYAHRKLDYCDDNELCIWISFQFVAHHSWTISWVLYSENSLHLIHN